MASTNEVTYIKVPRNEVVDFAAAVVDIVSHGSEPVTFNPAPRQRTGWAHKHGYTYCTWKRRFLRLEKASIAYYKGEDSAAPKGVVQLTPYTLCRKCEKGEDRAANAVSYMKLVNGVPQLEKVRRDNGLAMHVPESSRTYYVHFATAAEREDWYLAIGTNIEVLRRQPGVIEDMISKVSVLADNGTVPREKIGIIKMALRGRYLPRIDPGSSDPFLAALRAVALGDLVALKAVMVPEFLKRSTQTGTTLLIKACTMGSLDTARVLLDAGADVNQAKDDGDTPLIVAARLNHSSVVSELLKRGAIRATKNIYNETAATEGRHNDGKVAAALESDVVEPSAPSMSLEDIQRIIGLQSEALAHAHAALEQAKKESSGQASNSIMLDLPPTANEQMQAVAAGLEHRRQTLSVNAALAKKHRISAPPEEDDAGTDD